MSTNFWRFVSCSRAHDAWLRPIYTGYSHFLHNVSATITWSTTVMSLKRFLWLSRIFSGHPAFFSSRNNSISKTILILFYINYYYLSTICIHYSMENVSNSHYVWNDRRIIERCSLGVYEITLIIKYLWIDNVNWIGLWLCFKIILNQAIS